MTVSSTGINYIDALQSGYSWTGNSGQATLVKYSFQALDATANAVPAAMQSAFTSAMTEWSKYAHVTFQSTSYAYSTLDFFRGDLSSLSSNTIGVTQYSVSGSSLAYAQVAIDDRFTTAAMVAKGSLGYVTILHEIGHALGLEHPGDYGQGEHAPHLPGGEDNLQNTIMSYYNGASVTQDGNPPSTPMIYDIAAIQHLYGANTAYNATATTYTFTGANTVQTLWDGGGVDTISASAYRGNATIDLREGIDYKSVIGQSLVWNAFNAHIENASTGSGNDLLTGNDMVNKLMSGAGNDQLTGGFGADSLYGGTGADILYGDGSSETGSDAADKLYGEAGNDTLYGGGGNDYASGGTENDTLSMGSGNDSVYGDAGNDIIYGFSGTETIYGGAGADLIYGDDTAEDGSDGADRIYGDAGNDTIYASGNNDYANGGADNDLIYLGTGNDSAVGGLGSDTIYGEDGNDTLLGEGGIDRLIGGGGNDLMSGGFGNDIFVFGNGQAGTDIITGFELAGRVGGDILDIAAANLNGNGYSTTEALAAAVTYSGGNAYLDLGGGEVIVLQGVTIHLIASDFMIG